MIRDVAERELDQAGHRISNLGEPKTEGDATKTDNVSTPKPSSGAGSPGKSFLAAPADHVHPGTSGAGGQTVVAIADHTEQLGRGKQTEILAETAVDLSQIVQPNMTVTLTALARATRGTAVFAVQIGGTPGKPDGKEVVAFRANRAEFEATGAQSQVIKRPLGIILVKVTATGEAPDAKYGIRAKAIQFRGVE